MGQYIATGANVGDIINKAADVALTVQAATSDPALPEVICLASSLSRISDGKDPGTCRKTVVTLGEEGKGIGLKSALPPLRAFVWMRKHPALATLIVTTALGAFWAWGYTAGRRSR